MDRGEEVDEQVAGDARPVVPIAAPLEEPLRVEWALRRAAEKRLPVHGLRAGVGRDRVDPGAAGRVAVVGRANHRDLPELAGLDEIPRRRVDGRADPLAADLQHAVVPLDGGDELEAFVDRVGHRLLDVDVLAGVECRDGHRLVQVVGRADDDRIEAGAGQQLARVLGNRRLAARACLRAYGPAGVRVADGDDLHAGNLLGRLDQLLRPRAGADHADGDTIAGGNGPCAARRARRYRRRRAGQHRVLHEIASVHGQPRGSAERRISRMLQSPAAPDHVSIAPGIRSS